MIFVFTGDGKGKTTAAIGQAIRVLGHGRKAALVQFIKSEKWQSGEERSLKKFGKFFLLYKGGKGFVGIMGDSLPRLAHLAAARRTFTFAKKIINSGKFCIVILDEINVALALKLIGIKEVVALLRRVPEETDVICTGRAAPKELIKIAGLVTECREIKHPYQKGFPANKRREY